MSYLQPRSITVAGRRTTVRLEETYWEELQRMAADTGMTISQIITAIGATRPTNLSSAIRVFVLRSLRASVEYAALAQSARGQARATIQG